MHIFDVLSGGQSPLTSRSFTIPRRQVWRPLMLKVRQVNPASRFAFLRSRLSAPETVVREPICKVAQCDLRPEFRGKPRQAVRALPRALAARNADHNERIEGEAIAIVHPLNVRFLSYARQGAS